MKKITLISALFFLFTIVSCSNKEKKLQTKIDANVKEFKDSKNAARKNELRPLILTDIDTFVKEFPSNEKSALYLFSASEITIESMEIDKSVAYLKMLCEKYPKFEKAPDALLNLGILSDSKGDVENAKKYYSEFIDKYPTHKNINVAKEALALVGKDVDEMVRQFEAKSDSLEAKK
ncbi:MAG: tetratricopeptide repeat protein [Bacteroidota bacterium]